VGLISRSNDYCNWTMIVSGVTRRLWRVVAGPDPSGKGWRTGVLSVAAGWGAVRGIQRYGASIRPCIHLVADARTYPWQRHTIRCGWLSLPHLSHIPFHLEAGEPFHIAREINACSHAPPFVG
jgi:hypothetical protein